MLPDRGEEAVARSWRQAQARRVRWVGLVDRGLCVVACWIVSRNVVRPLGSCLLTRLFVGRFATSHLRSMKDVGPRLVGKQWPGSDRELGQLKTEKEKHVYDMAVPKSTVKTVVDGTV